MGKKKKLSVSEFKTHALHVFARVENQGEEFEVMKRGKLIARVVPVGSEPRRFPFGCCEEMVSEIGDVVSPLGEDEWSGVR